MGMCVFLFCGAALAQQNDRKAVSVGEPPADHSWQAELATFKVLDGFEVSLFADESDGVANPIAIRWDERGRLWCVQTSSYPQVKPGQPANDKVVILEDSDGDGRADKTTVFADGLEQPMGLELAPRSPLCTSANGHSAYVGEGSKLWLMTDTDGDDVADVREVVFSGFGTGDTHQNLNSFIWSPDGSLVMHQGLHCYSKVATPWGTKELYGAGFWRYWPRSARLESYPTGMPLNPWGTVFDAALQPYMIAGAAGMFWARPLEVSTAETSVSDTAAQREDRQIHGIPHFLLSRQQLPYSGQIIKTDGLRKFCGIDIAGPGPWPQDMQDELVTGGFFENAIYRHKLMTDEEFPSGKKAVEQPPLISSDSVAFRPVDVRFGPDGALYIADWYNPIIGHYQASFRHPNRDQAHGRIWRVKTADGQTADARQEDLSVNADGRWEQYQAWRLMNEGKMDEAMKAVKTGVDRLRVGEMFERPDLSLVSAVWKSAVSEERAYAVHALGNWAHRLPAEQVLAELEKMAGDESPLVRLEVVVAAAKVRDPRALKVALQVLEKPMDSFIERVLWLACHATAKDWKQDVPKLLKGMGAAQVAFLLEKEGSAELLNAVRELASAAGVENALRREMLAALARRGDSADWLLALDSAQNDSALLERLARVAMERGGKGPDGAAARVTALLNQGDSRAAALQLAGAWRLQGLQEQVKAHIAATDVETRRAALWALGRLGGEAALFENVLQSPGEDYSVKLTALEALAETKPQAAGSAAAGLLGSVADYESMRGLLAAVMPRPAAVTAMTAALQKQSCAPDAAKLALRVLTATGQSAPELSALLYGVLGAGGGVPAYDPAWVAELAAEVKAKGDPGRGRAVFASTLTNCVACHKIGGEGGIIGPELDAVGRGVPVELMIEAIVWPNRQIKEGYVATTLTLKDGRTLQGYKIAEGRGELQLKDLLSGEVHRFSNAQIASKLEAGSLMPEGLTMAMTRAELADLVAYLMTLGR